MITTITKVLPETPNVIVTLLKAKKQLRIDALFTDEDDLIQDYIHSAVEGAEVYINGDLISKTMVITLDAFQEKIVFESYPIRSITTVKYYLNSTQVTMPSDDYYLNVISSKESVLVFKDQPNTDERFNAVEITAVIGFEDATKVPYRIKQAILLEVSDMYERRENRPEMITTAAQALMRPYRKYT